MFEPKMNPLRLLRLERGRVGVGTSAAFAIMCLGCGEATLPVQPTSLQPVREFSLWGLVHDTAFQPIAEARVEVVEGPRTGVVATTDISGRYALPGVFLDTIAVRASKDGYIAVTKTYQTAYPGPQALSFSMELIAPSVNIAGEYTVMLTADSTCTELPDPARMRTYTATIAPLSGSTSPNLYQAILSGATFYPSTLNDRFVIGVAGNVARFAIDFDGIGIAEELTPSTYVSISGAGNATVGGPRISVSLDGQFEYCAGPGVGPGFYRCAVTAVQCRSTNHRLTLTRR